MNLMCAIAKVGELDYNGLTLIANSIWNALDIRSLSGKSGLPRYVRSPTVKIARVKTKSFFETTDTATPVWIHLHPHCAIAVFCK